MKKKKIKAKSKISASHHNSEERPTLLEFMISFQAEATKTAGLPCELDSKLEPKPLPKWGAKTLEKLRKTVMRPVLKLKPTEKTTCKEFGKMIGILERQITFLEVDMWAILEGAGFDKISAEDWERIQPEAQLRAQLIRQLKRTVRRDEKTDDLAAEAIERKIEDLKSIRQKAFDFISTKSAKERSMFFDGLAQGYKLFLDATGNFSGDRGRTEIYTELLSSQFEIEKLRRALPVKNDDDLYDHLKPWYKFPSSNREQNIEWLRDVCDDIGLYIVGKRGRPAGKSKAKSTVLF